LRHSASSKEPKLSKYGHFVADYKQGTDTNSNSLNWKHI